MFKELEITGKPLNDSELKPIKELVVNIESINNKHNLLDDIDLANSRMYCKLITDCLALPYIGMLPMYDSVNRLTITVYSQTILFYNRLEDILESSNLLLFNKIRDNMNAIISYIYTRKYSNTLRGNKL